jgi:hypothetical protein
MFGIGVVSKLYLNQDSDLLQQGDKISLLLPSDLHPDNAVPGQQQQTPVRTPGLRISSLNVSPKTQADAEPVSEPMVFTQVPDLSDAPVTLSLPVEKMASPEQVSKPAIPAVVRYMEEPDAHRFDGTIKAGPGSNIPRAIRPSVTKLIDKARKKTSWQVYFSPSVSYRKLSGHATRSNYSYSGFAYSANLGFPTDVNNAVTHIPAIGIEVGTALIYKLTPEIRIRMGLQLNHNQYNVEAYSYKPEIATYGANSLSTFARPINTVSYFRNFNGYTRSTLKNERFMVSLPVGLELTLLGNERISFNVASTIQPTYVFNNRSYLISTDLKNYAQEPSLYRKWNFNTSFEAFLSIQTRTVRWNIGPQVRYQLMSSYKENYPIQENLFDYGIRIGLSKTLK